MRLDFLYFCILLVALGVESSQPCSPADEEFLISFHPHLDAFWLNTDTQLKNIHFTPAPFLYQMNQRNSKIILNSMLDALLKDKTRKYFITEVVFFKDWYEYLGNDQKLQVKSVLLSGQLEIVNGGWVENDEAICYFDDIIDQYTIGLNYLKTVFNYETKIGWATDSFGHSHSQVALLHLLGFEFQGIQRIDDRYLYQRKEGSLLQFYWSPVSDSNGNSYGGIVTYIRHFLHEVNNYRGINPQAIVNDFTSLKQIMKKMYHRPKFFRFLGNDFEEFITEEFINLEKGVAILNKNTRSNQCPVFKYGNPSDYLALVNSQYDQKSMPLRKFDFMPNWDQDHYWNGYYTTDPELKKICKDFSRLVNLFRKMYIKNPSSKDQAIVNRANELLALMQHHDGITATSKRHIQAQMKERMKAISVQLIKQISEINNLHKQVCSLYQDANRCVLNTQEQTVYLSIFHQGTTKIEKIQLEMPQNVYYKIDGSAIWQIFCLPNIKKKCYLVFEASIMPGQNVFVLKRIEVKNSLKQIIFVSKTLGPSYSAKEFQIDMRGDRIDYTFNKKEFFNISIVKAVSDVTNTKSMSWDKYGTKTEKMERRIPGIYIMTNNGNLTELEEGIFTEMHVGYGRFFTKIYAFSKWSTLCMTIKNVQSNILELRTEFQPLNFKFSDYFVKIQSNINPKDEFYHDMNGYLVMKRKVGSRPDYNWDYKKFDKIAANTYPLCSFAYAFQQDKKFVVFVDRAAGIALYDKAFILNIDRIAGDDYKGVGQGYLYKIKNTFVQKIMMVKNTDFIERKWQKQYDEPLIGFYSIENRKKTTQLSSFNAYQGSYLKYTVYNLNKNQFVLRLINLHEKIDLILPAYDAKEKVWKLSQLNLNLHFQKIQEAFLHGVPISQRKNWKNIKGEINVFNLKQKDDRSRLVLKPLQIRSFKITTKLDQLASNQKIISSHTKSGLKENTIPKSDILEKEANKKKPLPPQTKSRFRRRCF